MYYVFVGSLGLAAIYVFLIRPRISPQKQEPYKEPLDTSTEVPNDKQIVVSNITQAELREALADFSELYNNEYMVVYPRLVVANDGRLVVTFPFDIDFDPFCSVINYLAYTPEVDTEPLALGWGTFGKQDEVLPQELLNKPAMVFVPEEDENHMQVFVIAADGIGYHIPLMDPKKYKAHPEPEEQYIAPPFDLALASGWERERFEVVSEE